MIAWLQSVHWLWVSALSLVCWSLITVINAVVIRTYRTSPMATLWIQALYSVCLLVLIGAFYRPTPTLLWVLLPASATAYLADLYFFYAADRLDISLINVALCLQSFFMSIVGFTVYHEPMTRSMLVGAGIILCGVLLLSLYGSEVRGRTMLRWFLPFIVIYFPLNLARKVGVEHQVPLFTVVFYLILLRDVLATIVPLSIPSFRRAISQELRHQTPIFFAWSGAPVLIFFVAEFLQTTLYAIGPLSGVSLVGNAQPFVTLGLTFALTVLAPSAVEVESFQSSHVRTKMIAFTMTLVGLALVGGSA